MSRETPTAVPGSEDAHRECWDLLPWLVNDRLSHADRARIETHLKGCPACREELAAQRQLRERMAAGERVAYSPAASFEKLWSRIEELEREVPRGPSVQKKSRPAPLSRWLAAAVIVQALALAWLAISLATRSPPQEWQFRTVTSSVPALGATPRFRIVFATDVSVGEMQGALATHGLVIVEASASSEVFTVAYAGGDAMPDAGLTLERLRADRRVRFAEIAAGAPAP